ncbi:hypothetical protein ACP70R_048549 [Stipagrostis hirtigluma subsp. patula]
MAKAARTASTPLAGLGEELIIWEILARLPPKPLVRCRAVCRSWRRHLASPSFLLEHPRRQPSLPVLFGRQQDGYYQDILALDRRGAADPAAQLVPFARREDGSFRVEASCDGMLLHSMFRQFFSVCNPATRESAFLGVISGFSLMGFYRHRPTGEYRLLLYRRRKLIFEDLIPGALDSFYVFALGCDLPRCIGSSAMPPCRGTPVLVRGCLHWNPVQHQNGSCGVMTVFDTASESFRSIQASIVPNSEHLIELETCLFEVDGMLGMFNRSDGGLHRVDIWVLQDYEREVWELKYRVALPMGEIRQKFDGCERWRVMVVA